MTNRPDSEWLARNLAQLLSFPDVQIPKFPIGGGHGPVDSFSIRFSELFSPEATGKVDGNEVDKAGLKDALVVIQKSWNTDTSSSTPNDPSDPEEIGAELFWRTHDSGIQMDSTVVAKTVCEGGVPRINFLQLETSPIND